MVNARAPVARLIYLLVVVVVLSAGVRIEVIAALLAIQSVLWETDRSGGRQPSSIGQGR